MVKATLRLIFVASLCVGLTGCAELVRGFATEFAAALLKEATSGQSSSVVPKQLPQADAVGWHCYGSPRTCQYFASEGEICANSYFCAGQRVCISGRCATYTPNPALPTQMDKPCATSQDCSDGWRCYGSPMTCQPYRNLGESCATSVDCADALVCTSGLCAKYQSPSQ